MKKKILTGGITLVLLTTMLLLFNSPASAGWEQAYSYRMNISCENLDDGVPIVVNGSGGFTINGHKQIVWTFCSGAGTAVYYNDETDYIIANNIEKLPMEVEFGDGASYNPTQIWGDYVGVYHLTTCVDSTSNSLDGTVTGATSTDNAQTYKAYHFDGSSDRIEAGVSEMWEQYPLKFEFNIYPTVVSKWLTIFRIQKQTENGYGYMAFLSNANKIQFYALGMSSSVYDRWESASTIPANEYTHIEIIYNGDNDVTMYFDGDEISVSQTKNGLNGAVLFPAGTNTKLIIGARYYGGNIYSDEFTGNIDDFKINNGLVATSASQAYSNQLGTSGFGNLGEVEDLTSPPTTTLPPQCGIGSGCSLCSGWVTKEVAHTGCGEPYTECVRDDNGDGIYDQVCCGGTVNQVMVL